MSLEIEKLGVSSFQFFPIRTDLNFKYIKLDTKAVIELFINKTNSENTKNFYLNDILYYKLFPLKVY